jgi:hypothetical protein
MNDGLAQLQHQCAAHKLFRLCSHTRMHPSLRSLGHQQEPARLATLRLPLRPALWVASPGLAAAVRALAWLPLERGMVQPWTSSGEARGGQGEAAGMLRPLAVGQVCCTALSGTHHDQPLVAACPAARHDNSPGGRVCLLMTRRLAR